MPFRDATDSDFELTWQIKTMSIKPYIEQIWGWDNEVQREFHRKDFKPHQIKIISDGDGNDIGLLNTTEDEAGLYINNILISEHAQGQGIGTVVLKILINQTRSKNKRIALQVLKVNERAKRLYESLGFNMTGQTEFHYQMEIIDWNNDQL
jgi:ribosomal protein S18 acetylase RimI-like enzyme